MQAVHDMTWEEFGFEKRVPGTRARRDRLVSALLQDRHVLRLISAPHGYGKSELAHEYAERLFVGKDVVWMDASAPDFLGALDAHSLFGSANMPDLPDLLVVDDLPYLDEGRADTLVQRLDSLMRQGVEVIVTTLPSHDCLRCASTEHLLLHAADLRVEKGEYLAQAKGRGAEERERISDEWGRASGLLFGDTAYVCWGSEDEWQGAQEEMLCAFFDEKLSAELFRSVLCMLLLGTGTLADLERMGCRLRPEYERVIAQDYPLAQLDPVEHSFQVLDFEFAALRRSVDASRNAALFAEEAGALSEHVLSVLFEREDLARAAALLDAFCTDAQCVRWLSERGWQLVDCAELKLAEGLFSRCDEEVLETNRELAALRAWQCGLQGNWREAGYYARRVLPASDSGAAAGACADIAGAMAYLALLAFGDDGPALRRKGSYAGAACPETPADFLAAVVDLCSEVELQRALCMDDAPRFSQLEERRANPSPERERALQALFTGMGARFHASGWYRLALHLLSFVDSTGLHRLVQDLSCDTVVCARRHGLRRTSEAFLIRDMWLDGYFGSGVHVDDRRDAALLDGAARMLRQVGAAAGYAEMQVPWELGGASAAPMIARRPQVASARTQGEVPLLKARLFGGFEVTVGERFVKDAQWRRKARVLFITLLLNQGRDVARDELLEQLWPYTARTRALDNFYTAWSNLARVVDDGPYLQRSGDFCRVNAQYVVSDVAEFEQLTRRLLVEQEDTDALLDVYARIEGLYRGGLLPSESGSEHIDSQRARYKAMFTDAMVAATSRALEAGNVRVALWFARKVMEVEPEREDVYHALIRAQIAAGQRCAAIHTYFKCREYLRESLGLDPSVETQRLYDHLIAVDPSLLKLDAASFAGVA